MVVASFSVTSFRCTDLFCVERLTIFHLGGPDTVGVMVTCEFIDEDDADAKNLCKY